MLGQEEQKINHANHYKHWSYWQWPSASASAAPPCRRGQGQGLQWRERSSRNQTDARQTRMSSSPWEKCEFFVKTCVLNITWIEIRHAKLSLLSAITCSHHRWRSISPYKLDQAPPRWSHGQSEDKFIFLIAVGDYWNWNWSYIWLQLVIIEFEIDHIYDCSWW